MNTIQSILFVYTQTPLHVGTGSGLGAVDMPIQREKHTNYPIIQASGVKGALRDTAELGLGGAEAEIIRSIFGGASGSEGEDHAGAVSPSDARILCFPVRALKGVFVWVTSPTVLSRFERDTGIEDMEWFEIDKALVSYDGLLVNNKVMLEEFTYDAEVSEFAANWADYIANVTFPDGGYWQDRLRANFVILPDEEFRDFVRYSTEIVTRIHLDDETKIVKDGQLFTQELLPADSILYSIVKVTDSRDGKHNAAAVLDTLQTSIGTDIQIGGDETVGRGRVRLSWIGGEA